MGKYLVNQIYGREKMEQSYAVLNPENGKFEIVDFIETYQTKASALKQKKLSDENR